MVPTAMTGAASLRSTGSRSRATVRDSSTVIAMPRLPMRSNVDPVCGSAASSPQASGPHSPLPTGMSKAPADAPASFRASKSFMSGIVAAISLSPPVSRSSSQETP
jgi:hypothetical protein